MIIILPEIVSKHWRTLGWSCSNISPAGRSFHEWETPWKWDSSTVCRGLLLPYLGSNPTIEMKKVIKVWQVFMFSVIHNNFIQSRLCVSLGTPELSTGYWSPRVKYYFVLMSTVTSPFPGSTNNVFVVFLTPFHSRTLTITFQPSVNGDNVKVGDHWNQCPRQDWLYFSDVWGLRSEVLSGGVSDSDWGPVCLSGNNDQPVTPLGSLSPPSPLRSIYPRSEPSTASFKLQTQKLSSERQLL